MYEAEIAHRAAIFFRLGYSKEHAIARLTRNIEWDFECGHRPESLTDSEIAGIVEQTYARRPSL